MSESAAEPFSALTAFRTRYTADQNAWTHTSPANQQHLFEQACELIDTLTAQLTTDAEAPADTSLEERYGPFIERLAEGMWAQGDWDTWASKPDAQKNLWRIKARRAFPLEAFAKVTGPTLTAELERLTAELAVLHGAGGGESDGHNAYTSVLRLRRDQARSDLEAARVTITRLHAALTDANDALAAGLLATPHLTLARVQTLHEQWAGPTGWSDMETVDNPYEAGYRTCWIDRDNELVAALTPPQDNEGLTP